MKNKTLPYIVGGILVAVLVIVAVVAGSGEQFMGMLRLRQSSSTPNMGFRGAYVAPPVVPDSWSGRLTPPAPAPIIPPAAIRQESLPLKPVCDPALVKVSLSAESPGGLIQASDTQEIMRITFENANPKGCDAKITYMRLMLLGNSYPTIAQKFEGYWEDHKTVQKAKWVGVLSAVRIGNVQAVYDGSTLAEAHVYLMEETGADFYQTSKASGKPLPDYPAYEPTTSRLSFNQPVPLPSGGGGVREIKVYLNPYWVVKEKVKAGGILWAFAEPEFTMGDAVTGYTNAIWGNLLQYEETLVRQQ